MKWVYKGELPPLEDYEAGVSSIGRSSSSKDEGLTLETSVLESFYVGNLTFIDFDSNFLFHFPTDTVP